MIAETVEQIRSALIHVFGFSSRHRRSATDRRGTTIFMMTRALATRFISVARGASLGAMSHTCLPVPVATATVISTHVARSRAYLKDVSTHRPQHSKNLSLPLQQ